MPDIPNRVNREILVRAIVTRARPPKPTFNPQIRGRLGEMSKTPDKIQMRAPKMFPKERVPPSRFDGGFIRVFLKIRYIAKYV